ncbi:MAG: DNA-binding protein [Inquilinus sp.]|uniref:helix-turn-helix domain-containing transcriptional regulator n=1 Tax=Inquilinus sp. TaxID=1932117 RepID=UPI003F39B7A9
MKDRHIDETMAEVYRNDPGLAASVLDDILSDGDQAELLIALRQMAKAFGGVQKVAKDADLNATQIYRTLSAEGNPGVDSLSKILRVMGLRLSVQPIDKPAPIH